MNSNCAHINLHAPPRISKHDGSRTRNHMTSRDGPSGIWA